jgi:hypothetical protein
VDCVVDRHYAPDVNSTWLPPREAAEGALTTPVWYSLWRSCRIDGGYVDLFPPGAGAPHFGNAFLANHVRRPLRPPTGDGTPNGATVAAFALGLTPTWNTIVAVERIEIETLPRKTRFPEIANVFPYVRVDVPSVIIGENLDLGPLEVWTWRRGAPATGKHLPGLPYTDGARRH